MGKYSHDFFGIGPYGMDDLENDSLGMDGVSCLACHKQSDEDLGLLNSGELAVFCKPCCLRSFRKAV